MRCSLFSFFALFTTTLIAQNGGFNTFSFADVPVSPLAGAAGGRQVAAFRGDLMQMGANPALMDSTLNNTASFSFLNYLSDINQAAFSYARLWDSVGLVFGSLRHMGYGRFIETDESGNEMGTFSISETEVNLGWSRKYNEQWSYGVGLSQFLSSGYMFLRYGAAFRGGLCYDNGRGLSAGAVLENIGARIFDRSGDSLMLLRPQMHIGFMKKLANAPILFGFQYNNLETWDLAGYDLQAMSKVQVDPITGDQMRKKITMDNLFRHLAFTAVFAPTHSVNFIGGFNFRRRFELANPARPATTGFSLGTRFRVRKFELQYAMSGYHLGGSSHHFGITTHFTEWVKKKPLP